MCAEEIVPRLDRYSDQNERGMSYELDRRRAQRFVSENPEFYFSTLNAELLQGWIFARGGCISVRNLEIAARELAKQGVLETRPALPEPIPPAGRGVIRLANVAIVRDPVTAEDRAKFADKPHESDIARKKRDQQLRLAAVRSRMAEREKKSTQ